jgi:uncharacterized protein
MSTTEALVLGLAAVIAGAINSIAGGGTLLTFPALLWFGVAPVTANATNTLALFFGTSGSIFSLRHHTAAIKPWLKWLLPISILGGWLGSLLLTHSSERIFATLVPFLILLATLVFIGQNFLRRAAGFPPGETPHPHRRSLWLVMCLQLIIAIYGGYFGAGIGILMLASMGMLGLRDLHQMNALKNVLAGVINCVAALWFVATGLIDWPRAAVMTVGAIIGYFIGAHYSQRVPERFVRRTVVAIGLSIAAVEFWKQFGPKGIPT